MSKLLSTLVVAVLATASVGAWAGSHGGAMDDKAKAEKMAACKKMDAKADDKMKADCKAMMEEKKK